MSVFQLNDELMFMKNLYFTIPLNSHDTSYIKCLSRTCLSPYQLLQRRSGLRFLADLLTNNLIERLRHSKNIILVETRDINSTIRRKIDMELVDERLALLRREVEVPVTCD